MAAAVDKRRRSTRAVAKQHDRFAADTSGERFIDEFVGPGTDIPSIAQQHLDLQSFSWAV
jgi:hypothetical protein